MVCLAPRALEEIVRPRRLAGLGARTLNFTVRRVVSTSDSDQRPPPRIALFYVLLAITVCAIIGAAIWVMPRVPGYWDLRWLVAFGLMVVLFVAWGAIAKLCGLTDEDTRHLLPKLDDDASNNRWRGP